MKIRPKVVWLLSVIGAIALLLVIPHATWAARPGPAASETASDLWVYSFETFLVEHSDLSEEQVKVIWKAIDLGNPEFFSAKHGDQWLRMHRKPMLDLMARIEEVFSKTQRGEIFSRMGPAQDLLIEAAVTEVPFCDCAPIGADCADGGICSKSSCITWKSDEGKLYLIGRCLPKKPSEETPDER